MYSWKHERVTWAGRMVRMKDDILQKGAEAMKQGGCRKRGRQQLRWEDCLKRGLTRQMKKTGRGKRSATENDGKHIIG